MNIIFQIELPFWIDVDNKFSVEYKTEQEYELKIVIIQDLWKIHVLHSETRDVFFVTEDILVDPHTMNLRQSLQLLEEYGFAPNLFYSRKMKSVIEIILDLQDSEIDMISIIQNIRPVLINEINRFLRMYGFIKTNSDYPIHNLFPVYESYFTRQNTIIKLKEKDNSEWVEFPESSFFYPPHHHTNYPAVTLEDTAQEYLVDGFQKNHDLNAEEKIRDRIFQAKQIQDMNSYIIQLSILLESKIQPFLELEARLKKEEIDSLLKEEGLRIFVKYQLPHFLGQEHKSLIESAQKIVDYRNLIVHRKANYNWEERCLDECSETWELIKELDKLLGIQHKQWKTKEIRLIGLAINTAESGTTVQIKAFETGILEKYVRYQPTEISEQMKDFIEKGLDINLAEYEELNFDYIGNLKNIRLYGKDNSVLVFLIPNIDVDLNIVLLQKLFTDLAESEDLVVNVYILRTSFPIKREEDLFKRFSLLQERYSDRITIAFNKPILMINPLTFEIIRTIDESDEKKLPSDEIMNHLLSKDIIIEVGLLEMLCQNILQIEMIDNRKYYSIKGDLQLVV